MSPAITYITAFDPASMFIILVLLLAAPLIIAAGFLLGWWGRNASQSGEFDVDAAGQPVAGDGPRPAHTTVSSRTLERTATPDESGAEPRPRAGTRR